MRRKLAEAVVEFLNFSGKASDRAIHLSKFSQREWERTLPWLDDAGLTLYFLKKLKDTNTSGIVPPPILSRLQGKFAANQGRTAYMALHFESLNRKFHNAGVKYAVVKGFSLVPQFCPDACLRPQSDLDYMVEKESLTTAHSVLEEAGYFLKERVGTQFCFSLFRAPSPKVADGQYHASSPHTVELHTSIWDGAEYGMSLEEPRFSAENTRTQQWNGLTFPALEQKDALLIQVLHALGHIFSYWLRLSSLYEIGYFLNEQATDTLLWNNIERRADDDPVLREVVALIAKLAAHFFGGTIPATINNWVRDLRPAVRVWIENYARTWVFGKNRMDELSLFPTAKLVLFLNQQYASDARHFTRSRLLPLNRLPRIAGMTQNQPATIPDQSWRRHKVRRTFFHMTASLRYLWEIPRWRRLNGTAAQVSAT